MTDEEDEGGVWEDLGYRRGPLPPRRQPGERVRTSQGDTLGSPTPWPPPGAALEHVYPVPEPVRRFLQGRGYTVREAR